MVKRKGELKCFTPYLFLLLILTMIPGWAGYDDPFYDYRGQNSFRESESFQPEERFDPFTGNFYLIYTDVYLPGNAGLDIKIMRVYNSDIYRRDGAGDVPVPDSWVGLGWSLHMGRLVCPTNEPKYLEMPDGSKHQFYIDINDPSRWISKEYWILKFVSAKNCYEVYFTNGIKWTFSLNIFGSIPEAGNTSHIYYPTILISDPFGNKDTIDYQMVTNETFIKWIKDNLGRTITFNYSTTGTKNLNSINVNGNYIYYEYTPINADYSLLTKVRYPEDPAGYYSYRYEYSTTYPENELKKVYNPWGGYIQYTFGNHEFNVGGTNYRFRVLTQRQMSSGGVWTIFYGLTSDNCDSVCITDPYNTKVSFVLWGYRLAPSSGNNWKLGLMVRKWIAGSGANCLYKLTYESSPAISNDDYYGPTSFDNQVYVPRLTKKEVIIDGKTYTTNYSDFDNYSQPRTIQETGDATRTITRTYWYNTSLNIIDRLASETINYNSTSFTTNYSYNNLGLMISKSVAGVTTTYTYHSDGNLKRTTDASNRWIENEEYQYGVPRRINKGGVYTINRTINWAGTIASETNGRGYTTSFLYDGRNRLTRITPPIGDVTNIEYHNQGDYKKVSRGQSWIKYNYDDWGRVDYTENSVGIKVDYTYDNLDRKTFESYPYTNSRIGDTLTYDGLDRIRRVTHPDNSYCEYTYYQSKITYRNERGKNTEFQYIGFGTPFGEKLLGSVRDALNQTTTYSYNAAGYLTSISAAGNYNRTYNYNSKYFLASEIAPERGQINYSYDNAGNLIQRTDANGNITNYTYDNVTRLTAIDYPGALYDINFIMTL
jgi:YD repeat-containing protein